MGRVPTIYYCPYEDCGASYNRKHRLETHITTHTGERPFICSHKDCGKNFTSSSHLKRHERTHGSSYRCTVENCPAVLKTKDTLMKHIKLIHLNLKKKLYTCSQCGKDFNKHNTLQRHELRHSGQLPYKCSVEDCQKSFTTPSKLKRHMKIHEGYPCKDPHCDEVFEKWSLYVQHARDCHRPEYKCEVCNKKFSSLYNLKLHVPVHFESKLVYQCEVPNCSRYYFAERNLKWHMRKYHAKRPFMCDKDNCNKGFKTEADLAEHILYHGKKKPRKKKNKRKKPKPSLAAILSGCAEVKQVSTESNDSTSSSKVNLEPDSTKILLKDSLESNQSSKIEENISSAKTFEAISVLNLLESIQLSTLRDLNTSIDSNNSHQSDVVKLISKDNILEMSTITDKLDSMCSTQDIIPMECEIDSCFTGLKSYESAIQEYTTIEVVSNNNLSHLISVPVIKIGS